MKEKALLNQIVLTMILQTIDQIKVDIIEMTLYRILNGTIATDILDSNLHQIKTFGCLAIINANEVKQAIWKLKEQEYIELFKRTEEQKYAYLRLTSKGKVVLQQNTPIDIDIVTKPIIVINTNDREKYEKLRKFRNKIAEDNDIKIYFLTNNSALLEILRVKPRTKDELEKIDGVFKRLIEDYAELFLEYLIEEIY